MPRTALWVLIVVLALGAAVPLSADGVEFTWAFVRKTDDCCEVIDFGSRPSIESGDHLRIYIEAESEIYIYLFLFDTSRSLYQLYPPTADYYRRQDPFSGSVALPSINDWFVMDDSRGTERFTLLASNVRLDELEEAAINYAARPDDAELQAEVLAEMRKAIQEHSDLATITERGVAIAGAMNTRGPLDEIDGMATEVVAEEFYGKTLRLRHE